MEMNYYYNSQANVPNTYIFNKKTRALKRRVELKILDGQKRKKATPVSTATQFKGLFIQRKMDFEGSNKTFLKFMICHALLETYFISASNTTS